MGDELMTSGAAYTFTLLRKWEEVIEIAEKFRQLYIEGQMDSEVINAYASKLTRFWLELYPQIENRDDSGFDDICASFKEYEKYYLDPKQLISKEGTDDLLKLEFLIRKTLHKLGITDFERERR